MQSNLSHASPAAYNIDLNRGSVNLVPYLEYNIGNNDPLEAPPVEGWSTFNEDYIKLGYDDRVHWFRLTLENNTTFPASFYFELNNPLVDNITFYTLKDGKVRSVQNIGDSFEFKLRPVLHESFVIPLSLLVDDTLEVYVAVQTAGSVNFKMTLWQKESFQQQQNYDRLINGIFIGLILAAIFAYLIVFLFSQNKNALLDAGLMTSLLLITSTMNGLAFHYLWPEFPVMQQHAIYLFSCGAIFCSALLAKNYIDHVQKNHILTRSFMGIALCSIIVLPFTLYLSYQFGLYLITVAAITICGFHIYSGYWLWKQGLHEEQDLNVGVAILLCALLFIAVNSFTAANLPFTNLQLLQIAMILIVTILSVNMIKQHIEHALVSKNYANALHEDIDDEDNISALPERLPDSLTNDLEKRLAEQNLELQLTLRELEDRNSELEKLNTLDALSGIHNRRHFDKRIQAELRRSRRELSPLSVIMFDVDHFKKVNDTSGHVVGDEVIRTVALTADKMLNRSSDELFRYGGEEFAVLLPSTELEGAYIIAEKIRIEIEQTSITTSSDTVKCTVSAGVACTGTEHNYAPDQILELADKALYQAKETGRNKVVTYKKED